MPDPSQPVGEKSEGQLQNDSDEYSDLLDFYKAFVPRAAIRDLLAKVRHCAIMCVIVCVFRLYRYRSCTCWTHPVSPVQVQELYCTDWYERLIVTHGAVCQPIVLLQVYHSVARCKTYHSPVHCVHDALHMPSSTLSTPRMHSHTCYLPPPHRMCSHTCHVPLPPHPAYVRRKARS